MTSIYDKFCVAASIMKNVVCLKAFAFLISHKFIKRINKLCVIIVSPFFLKNITFISRPLVLAITSRSQPPALAINLRPGPGLKFVFHGHEHFTSLI